MLFEKKKKSVLIPQIILGVVTVMSALYVSAVALAIWKKEKSKTENCTNDSNGDLEPDSAEQSSECEPTFDESNLPENEQPAVEIRLENPQEIEDTKFNDAIRLAVESGKISTSLLQRKLSIGYGRASNIISRMEALGYIGTYNGNRPRELLPEIYNVFDGN